MVTERVREAVIMSSIKWENIDYLEAVRYIALNLTAEECTQSGLRRVLPWRRKTTGTRPGLRGEGPKNKVRGDQEQWCFPN